jgi:hypothetical protein
MSDWWRGGEVQDKATANLMVFTELQELCTHPTSTPGTELHSGLRGTAKFSYRLYFKDRPLSDPRCVVDAVIFSLRENGFIVYIPDLTCQDIFILLFDYLTQGPV